MKQFYRTLQTYKDKQQVLTLTGISGKYCGYKGIFCEGQPVCQTDKRGSLFGPVGGLWQQEKQAGILPGSEGNLYFEKLSREKELLICGGGHVANAVVKMAVLLDMPVTVIEDRPEFAVQVRESGADHVICKPFTEGLRDVSFHEDVYCLIMTRGHLHDRDCLRYVLQQPVGYTGMLGSKKRVAKLKEELEREGFAREKLEALYTPVGLKIQAHTPAEIAVSILGQIISVKNSRGNGVTYEGALADFLFDADRTWDREGVLITIIGKSGSAPRDVGTKMIVKKDGALLGTIGGGFLEAEAVKMAKNCLTENGRQTKIRKIEIVSKDAAEEGMHCGGSVMLLFEML